MKKALLVIDLQNGVSPLHRFEETIENVNLKISEFHSNNEPVIFIQHQCIGMEKGTKAWEFVPELPVTDKDIVVAKTQCSAFYHTDLEKILSDYGIDTLEICGAQTEYCVDTTIKAAFYNGYKIIVNEGTFSTVDNETFSADKINQFYFAMWKWLSEKSPIKRK